MPPATPFPDLTIPGLASNVKYCIFRVDRTFDGMFEGAKPVSYTCESGHEVGRTVRFPTTLTWRITAALQCDESLQFWPSTQLSAKGITIARDDGFAHFAGKFSIVKKNPPQPDVPYFRGILELICRSGSHQTLGEACDEKEHIEGWLIGKGQRPVSKFTLRAVIVAKGQLATGVGPFPDTSVNRITGTLIKRP
ncbi:MAG TPA: hypothetical protein VGC93_15965 [Thermoanaerobaculia bacterium]